MKRKDLTTTERNEMVQFLLEGSKDGKPKRGNIKEAILRWQSCRRNVSRLWASARKQREAGQVIYSKSKKLLPFKTKRVEMNLDLISSIEYSKRSSIRILTISIACSKTTVGRWIKCGLLRAHTSSIRPDLTTSNKLLRLKFSLNSLELDTILNILRFKSMQNIVHIDEKWLYMTRIARKFYLTKDEEDPHRTCKSKNHLTKVMFMCAVSRPLIAGDGTVVFYGKIGIFPFTIRVPPKRASKNRAADTIETKAIESVTKDVIRDCLINQIIPTIKAKWHVYATKTIYIQQDNAKPHISDSDPLFREAATSDGFNIFLVQQPPNSSDTNMNDLGWIRAIQSEQLKTSCNTIDELIDAVHASFEKLDPVKLNHVFLSLQGCMVEIMKCKGENRYKVPHMGKDALARANALPSNLEVPLDLVLQCLNYLTEVGCMDAVQGIKECLGIN